MELRTTVDIVPSCDKITYKDSVMFIGSCFASYIGSQMIAGRMPVMINPAGVVYNPVSVCNTLDTIMNGKEFVKEDLYYHNGTYLSFNHATDFSSDDPEEVLNKINRQSREALQFLKKSRFLFITFGTSRVYRWKMTDRVVSNCHKIPADQFISELLSVSEIVNHLEARLERLHSEFPNLKVVFTISPVRHWKDGAHGNQVSKSVLFLAVEDLLEHPLAPQYFPAYELVMDDLRDYRFYSDDMLHPSVTAIKYIWNAFAGCYMDQKTQSMWKEVAKVTRACTHHLGNGTKKDIHEFAHNMITRISEIEEKEPEIDLSNERNYFNNLLK